MKGRLFTILSALSLLLCVAVVVLWVRSYFVSDELVWRTEQIDRRDGQVWNVIDQRLTSSRGWWSSSDFDDAGAPGTHSSRQQDHAQNSVDRSSFRWQSRPGPIPMQFVATRFGGQTPVPYWLTGLVLAVLPALWLTRPLRRRWQRRRRKQHIRRTCLCPSCGYDLRATPGRCPECAWRASKKCFGLVRPRLYLFDLQGRPRAPIVSILRTFSSMCESRDGVPVRRGRRRRDRRDIAADEQ